MLASLWRSWWSVMYDAGWSLVLSCEREDCERRAASGFSSHARLLPGNERTAKRTPTNSRVAPFHPHMQIAALSPSSRRLRGGSNLLEAPLAFLLRVSPEAASRDQERITLPSTTSPPEGINVQKGVPVSRTPLERLRVSAQVERRRWPASQVSFDGKRDYQETLAYRAWMSSMCHQNPGNGTSTRNNGRFGVRTLSLSSFGFGSDMI